MSTLLALLAGLIGALCVLVLFAVLFAGLLPDRLDRSPREP